MTTTHLFSNRATAKIAVDLASNDTAITLVPGGGALFPQPGANQFFRLVLQKGTAATDQREYMTCSNVTGDVLTVQRGLEGTPAANFTAGDDLSLVATALTFNALAQKVGVTLQGALEVEAAPTTPLGIATKSYVDGGRLPDAPTDGKDYARNNAAWHALGAAAGLAVPIPISAGGTGGATLPAAQTNLVIGVTTIDDLAPATPKYGDRWIKPSNMTEMVWVPNAGGAGVGVWINPADAASEAYPLAVTKGGTGATDAPTALTNLGGTTVGKGVFTAATQLAGRQALGIVDYTANPFLLSDGTVAAPGLAWASEVGLGFYRPAASTINIAAQGARVGWFDASNTLVTNFYLNPRSAGGQSAFVTYNQPSSAANYNSTVFTTTAAGWTLIANGAAGSAAQQPVLLQGIRLQFESIPASTQSCAFVLNKNAVSGSQSEIHGQRGGVERWRMDIGDGTAESGTSTGSNFRLLRFDNSGNFIDIPFFIARADGGTSLLNVNATTLTTSGLISAGATISAATQVAGRQSVAAGGGGNNGHVYICKTDGSIVGDLSAGGITGDPNVFDIATNANMAFYVGSTILATLTLPGGPSDTQFLLLTQRVKFPNILGVAAGSNVYIEQADQNRVYKITSSARYKKDTEPMQRTEMIYDLEPIWFRMIEDHLHEGWSYYGFTAEAVAAVDPRLAHWSKDERGRAIPEGVQYDRLIVPVIAEMKKLRDRIYQLEHA